MQKLLLSLILLISSLSVLACPTGKIQYNDDSALSSEGIHDLSDGSLIPVKDMKEDYLKNRRYSCLLYTSPSPRDGLLSRMPSSA